MRLPGACFQQLLLEYLEGILFGFFLRWFFRFAH